jgi:hypothetical protein
MRSPETDLFESWQALSASGEMVGPDRPIGRVTIARNAIKKNHSNRPGPWRHLLFHNNSEKELTVKTIEIDRSFGNDSATCTIVLPNAQDITQAEPQGVDTGIGRSGYYSFARSSDPAISKSSVYRSFGESRSGEPFRTDWNYPKNSWYDTLIPNRLVRTYQGYGSSNFDENNRLMRSDNPDYVEPKDDTKLVLTGTWLIDSVSYGFSEITITCRDLGKLLLEQTVYPPLLPLERFPLTYCPDQESTDAPSSKVVRSKNRLKYHSASTNKHPSTPGHGPRKAFDGRKSTEWWGHSFDTAKGSYVKEWLQGTAHGSRVNEVYINARRSGYIVYISVMENGEWQGSNTIPYAVPDGKHSHDAGIKYVKKVTLHGGERRRGLRREWHYGQMFKLPRSYKASLVRITFTNLQNHAHPVAKADKFSVRVQEFSAYYKRRVYSGVKHVGKPGNISDWSQPIKELVSWAGLTWQADEDVYGQQLDDPAEADPLIGTARNGTPLRAWGDFEWLGTGPIVCTPTDFLLNKSFMEACRTIADLIGALFYIDEYGGAVFRMPNVYSGGNFVTDPYASEDTPAYLRRKWPIEFHEGANLLDYTLSINDSQIKSEILVVGTNPDVSGSKALAGHETPADSVISGGVSLVGGEGVSSAINFKNILAGQHRMFMVPGESTKLFKSVDECQRMAELIGVRILWSYRKGQAKILGHPGLQLDDQVRIFERVTNENNVHYVTGISSHMDLESGEYTMTVQTHWLGGDPDTDWFADRIEQSGWGKLLPCLLNRIGTDPGVDGAVGASGFDPLSGA